MPSPDVRPPRSAQEQRSEPVPPSTIDTFDRAMLWRFRARLHRPIDGDTFVALADCGFRVAAMPHIRIAGLDAVEAWHPGGDDARARLATALTPFGISEWPLRIVSRQRETVVSEVRSFERYVADVFVVRHDGTLVDVCEVLV